MNSTYEVMIRKVLSDGNTVSVFDGGEWAVKRSSDFGAICEAVESVEEAQIRIRDANGDILGWALIIPGLDDGESEIADCSDNEYMDRVAA